MDLFNKLLPETRYIEFKANREHIELAHKYVAESQFIYMKSLINAGFSSDHALYLVREHGLDVGKLSRLGKEGK